MHSALKLRRRRQAAANLARYGYPAIGALAADATAKAAFDGLAYTHRKEFARWVAEAKKEDTRDRRVAQALEMLAEGRTRS